MPFEGWQNHGQGTDDFGNNFFSIHLKKLHTNLETKIKQEAPDNAEDSVTNRVVKGKQN